MYVKLAIGNVRKSLRDYAVYFGTLCLAACLLYAFTASTDYLLALGLTAEQRGAYADAGDVLTAFSAFSVIVFAFLITYASRFIARRRKQEFATYALMGMRRGKVATVLALEGGMVGACSLAAGIAAGTALSPVFGLAASIVFDVGWRPLVTFSPRAALWTAGCFAVVMLLATALTVRDICRQPIVALMQADRRPETLRLSSRGASGAQCALGLVLLAVVWGACVIQPVYFVMLCLPMGLIACAGTYLVFRFLSAYIPRRIRAREERYFTGVKPFVVRQVEAKIESTCAALSCTCVLIATAFCMLCTGLLFSIGMRTLGGPQEANPLNPIAYVGIFYGVTFFVAAAAVLALQQASEANASRRAYRTLLELGATPALLRRAQRASIAVYFAVPTAMAFVHCIFGLALMAYLGQLAPPGALPPIAAATALITLAILGTYYLVTCRWCRRSVLPQEPQQGEGAHGGRGCGGEERVATL